MSTSTPFATSLILPVLFMISLSSCKKHSDASPPNPLGPDMYVLGSIGREAVYWNNGGVTKVTSDTSSFSAFASLVSGSDIYFGGSIVAGPVMMGQTYWYNAQYVKNGQVVPLPAPFPAVRSQVLAMAVSGADVYAAGTIGYDFSKGVPPKPATGRYLQGSLPTLWKNGIPQTLPVKPLLSSIADTLEQYAGYVSGLCISGGDVYVAGGNLDNTKGDTSTYRFAGYWKNGVYVNLSKGLVDSNTVYIDRYPQTSGIFVSGNDVYVAGYGTGETFPQALYWKNGVVNKIGPTGLTNSAALCIFVSGDDVYVGGLVNVNGIPYGTIWKNGVETRLVNAGHGCTVSSILVSGGDVYVTGTDLDGKTSYATYWKNGVPVHLSANASASAIFIRP